MLAGSVAAYTAASLSENPIPILPFDGICHIADSNHDDDDDDGPLSGPRCATEIKLAARPCTFLLYFVASSC
jgi:hypothetical protein